MRPWPAMLNRSKAAEYCGISAAAFEAEINSGVLPLPVKLGNRELWSRRKLDEALEALHGGHGDWRARCGLGRVA